MMQPFGQALPAVVFAQVVSFVATAPAVIRSHSHARGYSFANAVVATVELGAQGEGHLAKEDDGRNLCANACAIYAGGATAEMEQVCMTQTGECSVPMAG